MQTEYDDNTHRGFRTEVLYCSSKSVLNVNLSINQWTNRSSYLDYKHNDDDNNMQNRLGD